MGLGRGVEATTSTSTGTNISGNKLISSRRVLEYFILAPTARVYVYSRAYSFAVFKLKIQNRFFLSFQNVNFDRNPD